MLKVQTEKFEGSQVYYFDPYNICPQDVYWDVFTDNNNGIKFYALSFGGSWWPNIYIVPVEMFSHEEPLIQAVQNLYLTPEGKSYQLEVVAGEVIQGEDVLDYLTEEDLFLTEEGFFVNMEDVQYCEIINCNDFRICFED